MKRKIRRKVTSTADILMRRLRSMDELSHRVADLCILMPRMIRAELQPLVDRNRELVLEVAAADERVRKNHDTIEKLLIGGKKLDDQLQALLRKDQNDR